MFIYATTGICYDHVPLARVNFIVIVDKLVMLNFFVLFICRHTFFNAKDLFENIYEEAEWQQRSSTI